MQKLGIYCDLAKSAFESPNADNGYSIRDYRKVMTEFGTMTDFDILLAGIKQGNMRLIIDLVVNHTSNQNNWFVESRSSKTNPYCDFISGVQGTPRLTVPEHRPLITRPTSPSHFGGWSLPELKAIYDEHVRVLTKHDWDTVFLSNHDNRRIVSTFGDDSPAMRISFSQAVRDHDSNFARHPVSLPGGRAWHDGFTL